MRNIDKDACLAALKFKEDTLQRRAQGHYSCQDDGTVEDERHAMEREAQETRSVRMKLRREWVR